jgi:hypothetical protein
MNRVGLDINQEATPRRVLHIEYSTRDAVPAPLQLAIA